MFELYYSEKLRELEVERLGRISPHRASVLRELSSRDTGDATFLRALLTRVRALTIRRVATRQSPRRAGDSQRERACSYESATLRSN